MEYGSFASTLVQVIGCITPLQDKKLFYCWVAVTNGCRVRTSTALVNVGKIGKRRIHHEK